MEHITKSLTAMTLAVLAAFLFVLGAAFAVGAYASLGSVAPGTSLGLVHAADWLRFTAAVVALAGVCAAGWQLAVHGAWEGTWEVAAGALGVLLIAIGLLVLAITPSSRPAANVVGAVGIGVWAVLLVSRAARRSLAEERVRSLGGAEPQHQAVLWLAAATGLLLVAIGYSLSPGLSGQGVGITSGVLQAVGIGAVLAAVAAAPPLRRLLSRSVPIVLAGLATLTAAFVAFAIVAGLVLGPNLSLTGLRVGYSIAIGIELLAVGALGVAAWQRVRELAVPSLP